MVDYGGRGSVARFAGSSACICWGVMCSIQVGRAHYQVYHTDRYTVGSRWPTAAADDGISGVCTNKFFSSTEAAVCFVTFILG